MWALRRAASQPLRVLAFNMGSRVCCANSVIPISFSDEKDITCESSHVIADKGLSLKRLYHNGYVASDFFRGRHSFASQAGAESSGSEDDLEDGFSELETPASTDAVQEISEDESEDDLISESELSDDDIVKSAQNELELMDTEIDIPERKSRRKRVSSELFKAIMDSPGQSVSNALDKWVEEGKDLDREEISIAMLNLRKRRMYGRALQLSEWLETNKRLDFLERDYASRLDLIAKVRGLHKAENYIEKIPKSFRGEVIYRTYLASCVSASNAKKAEEVFNKMKDLNLPITAFACNQLLLLYKRIDKKKIADVLLLMENENVKLTPFTYKILIDTKGQSNDLDGMDKLVETMKAEGVELDINTQAIMARHYATGGLKEKAIAVLKEMEGDDLKKNRWASKFLLPIYASLGMADEVNRIWKVCKSDPRNEECMAGIEAWGKLKKVDEAERVFNKMVKNNKQLSPRLYSGILRVYANNKMLTKGKDLVKEMAEKGFRIGPMIWDALVKLYVEAGEIEKADSVLHKATQQSQLKPLFNSYILIMDHYARRGDIHNAEKIFYRMRQAGYVARLRQFQTLVQAYINAKAPAYGMRDRMKADNIFPNKGLAEQLMQVDAFRKTAVSELLD